MILPVSIKLFEEGGDEVSLSRLGDSTITTRPRTYKTEVVFYDTDQGVERTWTLHSVFPLYAAPWEGVGSMIAKDGPAAVDLYAFRDALDEEIRRLEVASGKRLPPEPEPENGDERQEGPVTLRYDAEEQEWLAVGEARTDPRGGNTMVFCRLEDRGGRDVYVTVCDIFGGHIGSVRYDEWESWELLS